MSFKVGDFVEIIDGPDFSNDNCRHFIGHCGEILGPSSVIPGNFYVRGAETDKSGRKCSIATQHLRLKRPPTEWISQPTVSWHDVPFRPAALRVDSPTTSEAL